MVIGRVPTPHQRRLLLMVALLAQTLVTSALAQTIGPGTRLSYDQSSASVRSTYAQAVWDPNCNPAANDCWIDPASGALLSNRETATASSEGWVWVDLLAFDEDHCVARVHYWGYDRNSGRLVPMTGDSFVTRGACLDYLLPTGQLQALPPVNTPTQRVLRGTRTLAGSSFETIALGNYGSGNSSQFTYDLPTGVLLIGSTRTQTAASSISASGTLRPEAGNAQLTFVQLAGARPLPQIVAPARALPATVLQASGLSYGCVVSVAMAGTPGMSIPCSAEVSFGARGAQWLLATATQQTADLTTGISSVAQALLVITSNGVGSLYLDPNDLRALQPGQLLDQDPITSIETLVQAVEAGWVVLAQRYPGGFTQYGYDVSTGWLRARTDTLQIGMATQTQHLELQAVR
jgi:hypothetical protein